MAVTSASNSPQITSLTIEGQTFPAEEVLALAGRYGLMPTLVREIIIDQAIQAIQLSEEERSAAGDRFLQTYQLQSPEQIAAFTQQRGLTPEQLPELANRDLKLSKYKEETWGAKVESHFLQRKNRLDRVLYSLIRTQEAGVAQELYFRIHDDGAPFEELAREYSEGQEAQTGGLIGPVELSVPHPALARILSISQPGQLWPPTRVGEWYVIVRLEKFLPAKLDDPTRTRLLEELYTTWLRERIEAVLKQVY